MDFVVGTVCSGKTEYLYQLAKNSSDCNVLAVCATDVLCNAFRGVARVVSAPCASGLRLVRLLDNCRLVVIDDIDYPVPFKWTFAAIVRVIQTLAPSARIVATCRKMPASAAQPPVATLRRCWHPHADFLKCVREPQTRVEPTRDIRLVPVADGVTADVVWQYICEVDTAVLCNSDRLRADIARGKRRFPVAHVRLHTNTKDDNHNVVCVTPVVNFYGRTCSHVVLVQPTTNADFVNGCTRHTETLTILFAADKPPAQFVAAHKNLKQFVIAKRTFVNWHSPPLKLKNLTVGDVARQVTNDDDSLDNALQRLSVHIAPSPAARIVEDINVTPDLEPTPTVADGAEDHGIAVEDVVVQTMRNPQYEAAPEFAGVQRRVRALLSVITVADVEFQVPVTLGEIVGRADVVAPDFVLEIKNTATVSTYALVQAIVYAAGLRKPCCYVFNARTGQLVKVAVAIHASPDPSRACVPAHAGSD